MSNNWNNRLKPFADSLMDVDLDDLQQRNDWTADDSDEGAVDLLELCSPYSPSGEVEFADGVKAFVPENYEPNYAYPLLVWLGNAKSSAEEMLKLMPQLSEQNYFGLSFPEAIAKGDNGLGFHSDEYVAGIERRLYEAVCKVRYEYNIHSERIYLVGQNESATLAIQMMLNRPEWYAGVVSIGGRLPQKPQPLARFQELHGRRILLGLPASGREQAIQEGVEIGRMLHSAGVNVAPHVYDHCDQIDTEILADINGWVMEGIYESNLV